MPRCFMAVRTEATEATEALGAVLRRLGRMQRMGAAVRPVGAESLHVTLRFLGDVDAGMLERLRGVLARAAAGTGPLTMRLVGLGAFPDARRPRVVWVGLEHAEGLRRIVARLEPALDALGFASDPRPWDAHVTLARVKARPPAELGALLTEHAATDFGPVRVESVELMTSELTRQGAVHHVAASVSLTSR
jgi:RNA 2',3'-cyclic 3'-phosphodiesterase